MRNMLSMQRGASQAGYLIDARLFSNPCDLQGKCHIPAQLHLLCTSPLDQYGRSGAFPATLLPADRLYSVRLLDRIVRSIA